MKAIVRTEYGSAEVMHLEEVPKPVPGDDELLVKVHAVSLNRSDWEGLIGKPLYTRMGGLRKPGYPILGSDVAGRVEVAGKNNNQFKPGDEIFGLIFLILFFALELPQGSTSTLRFGFLSDVTPIVVAPVVLAVMVILFLIQRKEAFLWSTIAALLGITGTLLTAWTNIMFVSGEITLEGQIRLFYISFAFLGPWHILVNFLARKHGALPSRLTAFGILVGVGQLIMFIVLFVMGGYEAMDPSSSTAISTNIPLLISLVIGIPMSLIGYLGAPIWLVWLGRTLMREAERMRSLHELEARS